MNFIQQQGRVGNRIGAQQPQRYGARVGQPALGLQQMGPVIGPQFSPLNQAMFQNVVPGATPQWTPNYDGSNVQTREVLGVVEEVVAPSAQLIAVPGVGPTVGNVCGFIDRCRTLAGCATATIRLKTKLPVQIQHLEVFGKDAKDLWIRQIISGCNVLTTGKGFSANVLRHRGKHKHRFDIDCANIAFDFFHPLEFVVENLCPDERDFHIVAQVWQLTC